MRRITVIACVVALLAVGSTVVAGAQATTSVSGRTVDADSGRPLPLVVVLAYEEDYSTLLGVGVSRLGGRFVVRGIPADQDEVALRFVGALTRHETGWYGFGGEVVPTVGESGTVGPGDVGDVRLDRR